MQFQSHYCPRRENYLCRMRFSAIIPARFDSTRFPGKPLVDLEGKSMIQRVYEGTLNSGLFQEVIVATDDERIHEHVLSFGGKVQMTSTTCPNGTFRCWEASKHLQKKVDVVVNVQGDEPLIHKDHLEALCAMFIDGSVEIASIMRKSLSEEDYLNSNRVKVVCGRGGKALYFSRSAIPYFKNGFEYCHLHLGTYAYRMDVLEALTRTSSGKLDIAESLEQLAWIESGFGIHLAEVEGESIGVDQPEDAERVRTLIRNSSAS
jgi:3-deoxy-manno-octulosonate cytidylyltransferase (CMP-KDO synthetase)